MKGNRATYSLEDFEADGGPISSDEDERGTEGGAVVQAGRWGFDVFDGLLFNFAAPVCIPYLLGVDPNAELDQSTREAITFWTASLTSLLLVGWAIGGILFGKLTDTFGRSRIMLITMATYALSTGASALSPNIWVLGLCRFCASLGIGGEWAAGAALVAETMPPHRRLWGGAILYTSAPVGLFLASFVSSLFLNEVSFIADDPSLSWRVVFLTGLIPVVFAIIIRIWLKEPDTWKTTRENKAMSYGVVERDYDEQPPPEKLGRYRRRTLGGLFVVIIALLTWWTITSFIPLIANFLAEDVGKASGLSRVEIQGLKSEYTFIGSNSFNAGGLVGTLTTVPLAQYLGRRPMFAIYFAWSAVAIPCVLYLAMSALLRLSLLFIVGFSVFGVFASFTFYLPELFPTRLRALGSGFCYNSGRVVTAVGPFLVGIVGRDGYDPLYIITWVAVLPAIGFVGTLLRLPLETKGTVLIEEEVERVDENLYLLHKEAASYSTATSPSASRYHNAHDEGMDIFLK
ncbi:transporter, major facilitator subfamily protein [Acanthamoeba castellanii str. Neff]|uniref:Transporter, major facilitator subfamily protein n=1 Tax=Acanthamoeba castellanii (strain ATCC 30010 / Neff) TaxID=1257118 RepID=L8HCU0_ACACF|nr:transporter, major facilitator subfamily protein [Acanthamoeba castellanii str. Neff]ELR23364.1 transporter, major facilitator subfamily protein [Acanthamoeba castellanii str. Neff]